MCVFVCVHSLPVQVVGILHVEQHGRDELVHVLRFPDDGLQLVVDRLSDHALQPADPSNTDPAKKNVAAVKMVISTIQAVWAGWFGTQEPPSM